MEQEPRALTEAELYGYCHDQAVDLGPVMPAAQLRVTDKAGTYLCAAWALVFEGSVLAYNPTRDEAEWVPMHGLTNNLTWAEERSAVALANYNCPYVPCGWSSSQLGSRPSSSSSSSSSHLSPLSSCGTCGGRRSLVLCDVVMVGKQEGHWSPGNQQQEPCHPFWRWPWKNLCGCYCLLHRCWACHLSLRWTSWR